jgi:hypothetical protein
MNLVNHDCKIKIKRQIMINDGHIFFFLLLSHFGRIHVNPDNN